MKKWLAIAATVAIIAIVVRQGTTQYGWNKESALEKLKEWSDRLGIWAIPTYVAVHTVTLALCLPHAVFFEAGASMLFGFLPALLCVFSAKVLAASFSFWIGRSVYESVTFEFISLLYDSNWAFGSLVCVNCVWIWSKWFGFRSRILKWIIMASEKLYALLVVTLSDFWA